jgi:hypothetical protein
MRSILWATFSLACLSATAHAQGAPDNRYCKPGNNPAFGASDGPAALPRSCFYTAISATPSPGRQIPVSPADNLSKAIGQAQCGDTLILAAGASYSGDFEFPSKGCDDAHWITVRTSGDLPPEGTRTSPCYAGVAWLAGRPTYPCAAARKAMAALIVPARASIRVTDHYRFLGLEITRNPGGGIVYNLVNAQDGNKLIFDRVWMHGTANDETTRAVAFPGASYFAVIDSYFSDFHCVARTGTCTDSQTVWAGAGPVAGGTYKIVNNYLESAAEGVLFGGGAGSAIPADIEIRRNCFCKPPSWNPHDPNFIGITYIVKNNLEFKNGARALVEGNVLENSWGGFSQGGFQLLLTPKNQNSKCPECRVHDITVRYSIFRHSGGGICLANAPDGPLHGVSQGMMNVSIHDVILDDINTSRYSGNGFTLQISNDTSPLHDLAIDHLTVAHSERDLLVVGSPNTMSNISITNSILDVGSYEAISTGGEQNCAFGRRGPQEIIEACWKPHRFANNLLIRDHGSWPRGNFSAGGIKAVGFAKVEGDQVLDFHLMKDSRYHGQADGQKDPGADVDRVESETAGVAY